VNGGINPADVMEDIAYNLAMKDFMKTLIPQDTAHELAMLQGKEARQRFEEKYEVVMQDGKKRIRKRKGIAVGE